MEDAVCPVTGLSLQGQSTQLPHETAAALTAMEMDPDIIEEKLAHASLRVNTVHVPMQKDDVETALQSFEFIPLNVKSASHQANADTRRLVRSVGLPKLREFTESFYAKVFVDPHLDQFIRRHDDPHGERFALWIAEKFGDGTPWTEERMTRPKDLMRIGRETYEVAHDRSSAHFAAWHSPKREAHKWGQHFTPDDARVWMRLHFWAAREVGLFQPQYVSFMDYYIRFIAHFVSVYSGKSPPFTRESARWSADPRNISKYLKAGNVMIDVVDMPVEQALAALPRGEREYTGSKHQDPSWPYRRHA
jgi:truncated hemoglobin YjbI